MITMILFYVSHRQFNRWLHIHIIVLIRESISSLIVWCHRGHYCNSAMRHTLSTVKRFALLLLSMVSWIWFFRRFCNLCITWVWVSDVKYVSNIYWMTFVHVYVSTNTRQITGCVVPHIGQPFDGQKKRQSPMNKTNTTCFGFRID